MILSFLADLFAQTTEVPFSRAKVALEAELPRWKDAGLEIQESAVSYLRQWIAAGWLREQDDILLYTDSYEVALRFVKGLDRREQNTTASHLRIVQEAVRDLAIAMDPNADVRIRALQAQQQSIAREIEELSAGIVLHLSDDEQCERLREVYQLASVLTGDFRRLEDDIRKLDQSLRVQMIQADSTRGDVLVNLLTQERLLTNTDAGRAFEGFFHLLADDNRTTEFREQLRYILGRPAAERLHLEERQFLGRLVRELGRESERVLRVRRRAEESLRAYVESSQFRESRAVARLLNELERYAVMLRDKGLPVLCRTSLTLPSGRAELNSVDSIRLRLPEESLEIGPIREADAVDTPSDAVLDHLETVKVLRVASEIAALVRMHGTMTLGGVIAKRPVTAGLEELVACLRVAQVVKAPRDEATETFQIRSRDGALLRVKVPTYVLTQDLLPLRAEDLPL